MTRVDAPMIELAFEHATQTAKRSFYHGPRHWQQVARVGLALCQAGSGADPQVVLAFACLHDTKRWYEGRDREHGVRAAKLARRLVREGNLELTPDQLAVLAYTLSLHNDRVVCYDHSTVATCWDADRFTLWRVGVRPRLGGISSLPGLETFEFFSRYGYRMTRPGERTSWTDLINEYKEML